MKKLTILVALSLAGGALVAADQTEAITQTTDLELTVPSGETWTYDKSITLTDGAKLVKKGSGTLILSNASNSFDGGVDLQQGSLRVDAEGALGNKKVVLSTTQRRILIFNASNATFPIDIEQTGAGSYDWNTWNIEILKTTHITGGILTTAGSICIRAYTSGATLEIDGEVNAGEKNIETDNATSITYNGSVTCCEYRPGRGYGSKGITYFKNSVNAIRRIRQNSGDVYPMAAHALDGTEFYLHGRWYSDSKSGVKLGGFDQIIPCLDAADAASLKIDSYANDAGGNIRSSAEATLTITGGVTYAGSDTAYCRYYVGYGTEKINLILDAPNFTQVFMERGGSGSYAHHTTGQIGISNGTFRVMDKVQFVNVPAIAVAAGGTLSAAITNGTTFGKCTKLHLDGKLIVDDGTLLPFASNAVDLELGPEAEIWLPEEMVFRVASLTVGGVPQVPGSYTGGAVKSGTLLLAGGTGTWTGGGGADTSVALAANWGGTLPDIRFGTAALRFATGGASASVDADCLFGTTTLSATDGFAFTAADSSATIGIMGQILFEKGATETNAVRTFSFAPPVTLTSGTASLAQTLNVPANDTVSFNGGLEEVGGSSATLIKSGAGTLVLGDGSVVEGYIRHDEGEIRIRGTLATPDHKDQGGAGSWEWAPSLVMDATKGKNQLLVLDGATVEKPFYGKRSNQLFTTVSNTVNVFKGNVQVYDPATELPANGKDGEIWFRGGVNCTWSVCPSGGGTVHLCDYATDTLTRTNNIRNINVGASTRFVFEGTKSLIYESIVYPYWNGRVEFRQSYATVEPIAMLFFGNQYGSGTYANTFDLCSTTQRVVKIRNNNSGRNRQEVITGSAGSALEITGGADEASTNDVPWTGCAALIKSGKGRMLLRYGTSTSTGDITVTAGELAFSDGASWRNGTRVTVAGAGRLSVTEANTFGRDVAFALKDDGVLSVADGVRVRATELTVDGVRINPGSYSYATAPAVLKPHLDPATTGSVSVSGGIVIMFR